MNQLIRKELSNESVLRFQVRYLVEWPQGRPDAPPTVSSVRFKAIKDFLIQNSYKVPWGEYFLFPGYLLENIKETQDMKRLNKYLRDELYICKENKAGKVHCETVHEPEEEADMESLEKLQTSRFIKIESECILSEAAQNGFRGVSERVSFHRPGRANFERIRGSEERNKVLKK